MYDGGSKKYKDGILNCTIYALDEDVCIVE